MIYFLPCIRFYKIVLTLDTNRSVVIIYSLQIRKNRHLRHSTTPEKPLTKIPPGRVDFFLTIEPSRKTDFNFWMISIDTGSPVLSHNNNTFNKFIVYEKCFDLDG